MTRRHLALAYTLAAAVMAALGAAAGAAIVAMEERTTRRLGDAPVDHSIDCDCGPDNENTDPAILNAHFGMNAYVEEMERRP